MKKIKIGFLGNNNNNNFAIARYMRDRGFDCDLLIFDHEVNHFHPSCDTYRSDELNWIRKLDWGSQKKYLRTTKNQIEKDLTQYAILVGCGAAAAYCRKINRRIDIFVPYGGDIWTETFYRITRPSSLISTFCAVRSHRLGMKGVKVVHSPHVTVDYENQINRYFPKAIRWVDPVPMIYAKEYLEANEIMNYVPNLIRNRFLKARKECKFILIAHGRHVWGREAEAASKGNKILIDGWKLFCDQNPLLQKKLVLVEYGADVKKSKNYIKKIGLESEVEWLPLMQRKEIMPLLMLSDMVAAEFIHSWIAGGVINEALVAGKPLLMHSLQHASSNENNLYPIFNANTPAGIAKHLFSYINDMDMGRKIGIEGRGWYLTHIQNTLDKYEEYFNSKI
jgi:hypothetical protein